MARLPDDQDVKRLNGLHDELDRLRQRFDAARNAAFDRRKSPDRRAHDRTTPDRRIIAAAR